MDEICLSRAFKDDPRWKGLRRLKLYFALSRTPHGILDMATPALTALLWLGAFPTLRTTVLGLMTAFAGYTAVYALNDLVDCRSDEEKIRRGGFQDSRNYLDAAILRHPLALGLLSFNQARLWIIFWAFVAVLGAYLLNPLCVIIFAAGCILEICYCLMWDITPFRVLVSGVVKTCGPVAAIFAVDTSPSLSLLAMLFLWLFFWEVGGQNIPNDWAEIEEDKLLRAKTVLVTYGPSVTSTIGLVCLSFAVTVGFFLFQETLGFTPAVAAVLAGTYILLSPAFNLLRTRSRAHALVLFNRASYYPVSLLVIVVLNTILKGL